MTVRSVIQASLYALCSLALITGCSEAPSQPHPPTSRGLVIFGVDGMDPVLLDQYMREGRMPNLQKLADQGSLSPLGTSNPPQSPVAWSTFITGQDSSGHGIFDFVHRDPAALAPYLSTSRTEGPDDVLTIGSFALPLDSGEVDLLRAGRAFWQHLDDAGVSATMVKIPANFPPAPSAHNQSLAGMGTPDLLGTYGTFSLYTDEPRFKDRKLSGGALYHLDFGSGQQAEAELVGPPNPNSATGESMTLPVTIARDRRRDVALVRVGETEVILTPGEFSRWLPIAFDPISYDGDWVGGAVGGMIRLYLASVRPHLRLHISPINLDPTNPVMPLSSPADYVETLAADVGRFYTQGMAEDTKALVSGAFSDDEFLAQAELVYKERLRLLDSALDSYRGGLLFFYFSSIDQVSHVFWRAIKDGASAEDARHAHVIPELYGRVDAALGDAIERLRKRLGPGVEIVVMSDHGFAPYDRQVHLNTWLAQRSYLRLLPPEKVQPGPLGHIDWSTTQAYALGLNQLFINLAGREAKGVVPQDEYDLLIERLQRDLESFRDPETGEYVITEAVRPQSGSFARRTPDLLIGYNRGYRSSDASAMGGITDSVIDQNRSKWSGDHCMHPEHVPGVLLTSWPLDDHVPDPDLPEPSLIDLAPTVLDYFQVERPATMPGRSLYRGSAGRDSGPEKPAKGSSQR